MKVYAVELFLPGNPAVVSPFLAAAQPRGRGAPTTRCSITTTTMRHADLPAPQHPPASSIPPCPPASLPAPQHPPHQQQFQNVPCRGAVPVTRQQCPAADTDTPLPPRSPISSANTRSGISALGQVPHVTASGPESHISLRLECITPDFGEGIGRDGERPRGKEAAEHHQDNLKDWEFQTEEEAQWKNVGKALSNEFGPDIPHLLQHGPWVGRGSSERCPGDKGASNTAKMATVSTLVMLQTPAFPALTQNLGESNSTYPH